MRQHDYPENVMVVLRRRIRASDETIRAMPPKEAFGHLMAWEFSHPDMADWIEARIKMCGGAIVWGEP